MTKGRRQTLFCLTLWSVLAPPAWSGDLDLDSVKGVYRHRFENGDVEGRKFPGEDILEIVPLSPKTAYFRLHLDFFNGHLCSLWGVADAVESGLLYRADACRFTVRFDESQVTLLDEGGRCREEACGARGSIDGATFENGSRRAIRYLDRILASRQYKEALAARDNRQP